MVDQDGIIRSVKNLSRGPNQGFNIPKPNVLNPQHIEPLQIWGFGFGIDGSSLLQVGALEVVKPAGIRLVQPDVPLES